VGLSDGKEPEPTDDEKKAPLYGKHSLRVLRAVARAAGVRVSDIVDADLELFDTQKAAVGGLDGEFLFCPRIDDKICSFAAITGLLESLSVTEDNSSLSVVALFDDEEIGSQLRQGAKSNFLSSVLQRLIALHGDSDLATLHELEANSFLLSADVIHAVNPNFSSAYLDNHKPALNKGVTISLDPNGHMTTDAISLAFIEEIARRSGNVLQYFQIRNGEPSGGTIGPMTSSRTGIRAVDLGIPQLSMHSIRATTGSKDVYLGARLFKSFFELWEEVDCEFRLGEL
jgi:aminopeptidase I